MVAWWRDTHNIPTGPHPTPLRNFVNTGVNGNRNTYMVEPFVTQGGAAREVRAFEVSAKLRAIYIKHIKPIIMEVSTIPYHNIPYHAIPYHMRTRTRIRTLASAHSHLVAWCGIVVAYNVGVLASCIRDLIKGISLIRAFTGLQYN